jgi:hypothetical protein
MSASVNISITKDLPQWTLFELQGIIEPNIPGSKIDGLSIGCLTQIDSTHYEMNLGNEILKGEMVKLPKPFIVFHKQQSDNSVAQSCGIAYNKIMFNRRPNPIIGAHKDKKMLIR